MSWIATYGDLEKVHGRTRVYIDYTDGSSHVRREYDVTDKDMIAVKAMINSEIKNLENQASFSDIKTGDVVDVTPAPVDSDKKSFLEDVSRLRKMHIAIELGIKKDNDADFIDLVDRVKSRFKEEYLDLL